MLVRSLGSKTLILMMSKCGNRRSKTSISNGDRGYFLVGLLLFFFRYYLEEHTNDRCHSGSKRNDSDNDSNLVFHQVSSECSGEPW